MIAVELSIEFRVGFFFSLVFFIWLRLIFRVIFVLWLYSLVSGRLVRV